MFQDQSHDIAALCAERAANAEFVRALPDQIGDNAVKTDAQVGEANSIHA